MYKISNIYVLAAFGTIGGSLFGFDVSSMSAWLSADQYLDYFHSPDSTLQGGITASMSGGSFIGALIAGFISDHFGRRKSLGLACIIWVIGAMIQCSSQNVAQLIVGRIVSGLAVGTTSSQTCVYLAELAPSEIRGRIVGIQQWAIEWGILIEYLIAYGCSFIPGPSSFRLAWGTQAVPAVVLFGALFFFPESPRWLAGQERWDESLEVLALLHGKGDINNALVQAEMSEVREAVNVMKAQKRTSWFGLFGPKVWKRTLCGTSVQMWQQLLGGNVAMYYCVYVFAMAGISGNVNLYSSAIQYVIFVVTTGMILPVIDRFPRRVLLLTGSIISCILMMTIAGVMASYGHAVPDVDGNANLRWEMTNGHAAKGVIALVYIFVGVYGFTWAPVGWVYCSEVFDLEWRAKGVGLSAATNWIFNFALAFFVAPAFTNITWRTYIVFGVFCFAMTFHIFFFYPETKGKTLEEMDLIFDTKIPAWRTSQVRGMLADKSREVEAGKRAALDGPLQSYGEKGNKSDSDVERKESV